MRELKRRELKPTSLQLSRRAKTNPAKGYSEQLHYILALLQATPSDGVKRSIKATKLVRSVTIISSGEDPSNPNEWIVLIRTDMNPGQNYGEFISARYCDCLDNIEQLEPGMFITIEFYKHLYDLCEEVKEEDNSNSLTLVVNKIWIDYVKTETDRTVFDFSGFGYGELDSIVSHKQLIIPS